MPSGSLRRLAGAADARGVRGDGGEGSGARAEGLGGWERARGGFVGFGGDFPSLLGWMGLDWIGTDWGVFFPGWVWISLEVWDFVGIVR